MTNTANMHSATRRIDRGALFLAICVVLAAPLFFRPVLHGVDPVGYFSWLRAAVIEGSLDVRNTWNLKPEGFIESDQSWLLTATTPTGFHHNQWAAGSAILWSPFYLVAHAGVLVARSAGVDIPADGMSAPYVVAASLGSVVYAFLAILMAYALARRFIPAPLAAGVALVMWLATPAVFYMYSSPLMSHANDLFLNTLLVYLWVRQRDTPTTAGAVAIGLTIGMATWVRTPNALLMLVPAADALRVLLSHSGNLKERLAHLIQRVAPVGVGFALLFIPLMVFWRVVFGAWIANTYSIYGQFLDLLNPRIGYVLFSSDRGLFTWTPVALLAVLGFLPLWQRDRRLSIMLAVAYIPQFYLIAATMWGPGASFGNRYLLNLWPAFTLGLAALADWSRQRLKLPPAALTLLGGAFVVWNLLLFAQYVLEWVPRMGEVDMGLLIRNQFLVVPHNLNRIIQILLTRS